MKCKTMSRKEVPAKANTFHGRELSNPTALKVFEFANGNDEVIEFEYDNRDELNKAYSSVFRLAKNNKFGQKLSVIRRSGKLYVIKGEYND